MVIDASAAIELLLDTVAGRTVHGLVSPPGVTLHAPHLIDIEVAQVLRRWANVGRLGPDRARGALEDLADLDIQRYSHDLLLPRVWELRKNVSAYDGAYLALAELLDVELVTLDASLLKVPLSSARVRVIDAVR